MLPTHWDLIISWSLGHWSLVILWVFGSFFLRPSTLHEHSMNAPSTVHEQPIDNLSTFRPLLWISTLLACYSLLKTKYADHRRPTLPARNWRSPIVFNTNESAPNTRFRKPWQFRGRKLLPLSNFDFREFKNHMKTYENLRKCNASLWLVPAHAGPASCRPQRSSFSDLVHPATFRYS